MRWYVSSGITAHIDRPLFACRSRQSVSISFGGRARILSTFKYALRGLIPGVVGLAVALVASAIGDDDWACVEEDEGEKPDEEGDSLSEKDEDGEGGGEGDDDDGERFEEGSGVATVDALRR